jgi:transcriptional regulator with GAF, ATPase, and Fis domain
MVKSLVPVYAQDPKPGFFDPRVIVGGMGSITKKNSWPGDVRELRNVVERAMVLTKGSVLHVELGGTLEPSHGETTNLMELERNHVRKVLHMTGWRIRGKNGAAELLGLKPSTLESRMLKLGIRREKQPRHFG